jgi:glycosyltransferase involved in cell wall biosynthesis
MKVYPKILIINSYSFNDLHGGGITLKNLFLHWPLDKIAMAHCDDSSPLSDLCLTYYKIGYIENHYIFPLNKLSTEPKGWLNGPYSPQDFEKPGIGLTSNSTQGKAKQHNLIKKWFLNFIGRTGLNKFLHPLRLSNALRKWILDYKPEIIYCQCGNLELTSLVLKVQKETKAKVVVHIMDDWPSTIYKDIVFSSFLRKLTDLKFRKLLIRSSLRLGISQAMADEFEKRYKQPFKYFHNPIDTTKVERNKFIDTPGKNSFTIAYSGRIGIASYNAILEFCKCIEQLRKDHFEVSFKIYTDLNNTYVNFDEFKHDGTYLLPPLKDDDFVLKLKEADLLLYPVDFDNESIEYIRLSFPTKLPSYLISGVPVFGYGPSTVYSIRFIVDNQLGFACETQDMDHLKKSVTAALTNKELRNQTAENAYHYACIHFDSAMVRASFHSEITNC